MEQRRDDPDSRIPFAGSHQSEEFLQLTDEDLFPLLVLRGEEADTANRALEELYHRHAGYLYHSLRNVALARYYGRHDLVHDTLLRAFERAETYTAHDLGFEAARRNVHAWLLAIARRMILEKWPKDREGFVRLTQLTQDCWEAAHGRAEEEGPRDLTPLARRAWNELKTLRPRDRAILILHLQWYDPELQKQQPPLDIVDQACAHYDISRQNYRQIISRSLRRIAKRLEKGEEQ